MEKVKTFVMGDLHGGYKALVQVLGRSKFDYENDRLISLGDVADGWPDVAECFEELMKIKNITMVRGNHDNWLLDYLRFEEAPKIWLTQGGAHTFASYQKHPELKEKHKNFLMSTPYYYVDEDNNLYVHGGLTRGSDGWLDPAKTMSSELMWSREMWYFSDGYSRAGDKLSVPGFNHVYVGHTSIWKQSKVPYVSGNVTFMDTGGGFEGVLSLKNVDTGEVLKSDPVKTLYPNHKH